MRTCVIFTGSGLLFFVYDFNKIDYRYLPRSLLLERHESYPPPPPPTTTTTTTKRHNDISRSKSRYVKLP